MAGIKLEKPSFFQIIPRDFTHRLRIPHRFSKNFDEKLLPKKVYIKNHNGDRWIVEVRKRVGDLFFEDGWRSFVKNNHIQEKDALFFRLLSDSMFTVKMYDSTGCEKQERIHKAKQSLMSDKGGIFHGEKKRAKKVEKSNKGGRCTPVQEDQQSSDIYITSDDEINFRQDVRSEGGSTHKTKQSFKSDKGGSYHREKKRPKKAERINKDDSDFHAEEHEHDSEQQYRRYAHPAGGSVHKAKRSLKSDKGENFHREKKRAKKVERVNDEHQDDSEEYITSDGEIYTDGPQQKWDKGVKRRLTRDDGLQKEYAFVSTYPFFKIKITPSLLKFQMVPIQGKFVQSYMPKEHAEVSILDPKGKEFRVDYKYYRGAGRFYNINGLEELVPSIKPRLGCIWAFELIDVTNIKLKLTVLKK